MGKHQLPPRQGRHRACYAQPPVQSQMGRVAFKIGESTQMLHSINWSQQLRRLYRQCRTFLDSPSTKLSRQLAEAQAYLSSFPDSITQYRLPSEDGVE